MKKKPLNMKFTTAEQDKHALEICTDSLPAGFCN